MEIRSRCAVALGLLLLLTAVGGLSQPDRDAYTVRFNRLDQNGDGALTAEEIPNARWFEAADADSDERITLQEILTLRRHRARRDTQVTSEPQQPPADALFSLAYTHPYRSAQATALVDLFGSGSPDLVIASKRQVHIIRNEGASTYTHHSTVQADRANGFGVHDFNADGVQDLFIAQPEIRQSDCWLSNNDGTFNPTDLGLETRGTTRNVVFADFDGDGHVDSYHSVSAFGHNHHGCELHLGNADGTFGPDIIETVLHPPVPDFWYTMVTTPEGGREKWANKQFKCAFVRDFDRDGRPDLVTAAYADRGFQDNRFERFAQEFVDSQDRGVFVLHNISTPGNVRFEEVAETAIGEDAYGDTPQDWNVYSAAPLDYDRDGDFDLFIGARVRRIRGGGVEDTRLCGFYENVSQPGNIIFEDRTSEAGFAWLNDLPPAEKWHINLAAIAPVDYDNDGWVDLAVVNRANPENNPYGHIFLFRNRGDGQFEEIPYTRHGLGSGSGGRDLCCGDLNRDGRPDFAVNDGAVGGHHGYDNSRIYENRLDKENHWLKVRVLKDTPAVFAVGSTVQLYAPRTDALLGFDEVRTDFCYRSRRSAELHFGLGNIEAVDIRVSGSHGQQVEKLNVPANTTQIIRVAP
ncbi:MAG: FG-GAP-like repeat-containing protein [Armatimonadota bacterium]